MYAVGSQRSLFDIPQGVAFFNTATNSPLLNASRTRLLEAAGAKSRPWERQPADFFAGAEHIRRLAAELFGADADAWAIVPAASYGVSAAARLIRTVASTNAGNGRSPLIGKFCTARSVCTPYSASAGTSRLPSGSFSVRVLSLIEFGCEMRS